MLTVLVILSLVTYRVTRFLVQDSLIDAPRLYVHQWLLGRQSRVRSKIYELITCRFCLSVWVAAGSVVVADQYTSVPMPWFMWLAVAAGAVLAWNTAEG